MLYICTKIYVKSSVLQMTAAIVHDRLNVMVFGDSLNFVRRLRDWVFSSCLDWVFSNCHINLNLDALHLSVYWHGLGGGMIIPHEAHKSFWSDRHLIHDLGPVVRN